MRRPLAFVCLVILLINVFLLLKHPPDTSTYKSLNGRRVSVIGQVINKEYQRGLTSPVLKVTIAPQNLFCESEEIPLIKKYPYHHNFICSLQNTDCIPHIGSTVILEGVFSCFKKATNDGQFDELTYYHSLGFDASIKKAAIVKETRYYKKVTEYLWQIRQKAEDLLFTYFTEEDAGVLSAMLLGDKKSLSEDTRKWYQNAGILHILSISGLHISLLGMGLYKLLRNCKVGVIGSSMIAGILIILYGVMIGMPVSAMRAIMMLLIRLLAECCKRTYDMLTALLLSAMVTVFLKPYLLTANSFLLSYSAILAILFIRPLFPSKSEFMKNALMSKIIKGKRMMNAFSSIVDGFCTSFSIGLFMLPIQLFLFYEVSAYAPFANILILPFISIILILGILCLSMLLILRHIPFLCYLWYQILPLTIHFLLKYFYWNAKIIGGLPYAACILGKPDFHRCILFYCILFIIINLPKLLARYKAGLLCGAILILICRADMGISVTFLDIGQGDAAVISFQNGAHYLMDCGSSSESSVGTYRLIPFLKYNGISCLEAVFLSHGDLDHISGVEEILENQDIEVKSLVIPAYMKYEILQSEDALKRILEQVKRKHIPILWCEKDMSWKEGEAEILCLHPTSKENSNTMDENENSLVMEVIYGQTSFLFTGDLTENGEQKVAAYLEKTSTFETDTFRTNILKVAHHGSKFSSTDAFLKAYKPDIAVISCGKHNTYGHPHKEVLSRLLENGALIYRTDESGAVTIWTDGRKTVCTTYSEKQ